MKESQEEKKRISIKCLTKGKSKLPFTTKMFVVVSTSYVTHSLQFIIIVIKMNCLITKTMYDEDDRSTVRTQN